MWLTIYLFASILLAQDTEPDIPPRAMPFQEGELPKPEPLVESISGIPTAEEIGALFEAYGDLETPNDLPELHAPEVNDQTTQNLPDNLKRTKLVWGTNPFSAQKRAIKEEKTLLIAFGSWDFEPRASTLAWEVFSSEEFAELSKSELILCGLDYGSSDSSTSQHAKKFREYYQVKGLPCILLFNKYGDPFLRKKGYLPGKARTYLNLVQSSIEEEKINREKQKKELELDGYREWTSKNNKTIFAKLLGKSEIDSRVYLRDEYGYRYAIALDNFSDIDQKMLPHFLELFEVNKNKSKKLPDSS